MIYNSYITNEVLMTINYLKKISNDDESINRVIDFLEKEIKSMAPPENVSYDENIIVNRVAVILNLYLDVFKYSKDNGLSDDFKHALAQVENAIIGDMNNKRR